MAARASIADDTAAIVAWQNAREPEKTRLFNDLFRSKAGLIRQLTQKAARAEKTSEDLEDLFQAGAIGFQKTLERFDASRGLSVSTYAAWWIRHEVQRVARRANPIALPRIRLTNAERETVINAIRENPSVEPECVGVRRAQFEQVRASFGLRYMSDDTTRGAIAVERKLLSDAGLFDGEQMLDDARRYRALEVIVSRVRAGESAEVIGLSHEAYVLALELIRADDEEMAMSEQEATETRAEEMNGNAPKRRPGRPKGSKAKAAPKQSQSSKLREQLAKRILEAEREKIVAKLAKLDDETVERILSSYAA